MANTKIEIKIGRVSFSAEGDQSWVEKQLDKVLEHLPEGGSEDQPGDSATSEQEEGTSSTPSLAKFLQEKNATKQVDRFLATAEWLRQRGTKLISTADVAKALRDNHQTKLGNPADCLNKNVKKGYCEKTAKSSFLLLKASKHSSNDDHARTSVSFDTERTSRSVA